MEFTGDVGLARFTQHRESRSLVFESMSRCHLTHLVQTSAPLLGQMVHWLRLASEFRCSSSGLVIERESHTQRWHVGHVAQHASSPKQGTCVSEGKLPLSVSSPYI